MGKIFAPSGMPPLALLTPSGSVAESGAEPEPAGEQGAESVSEPVGDETGAKPICCDQGA